MRASTLDAGTRERFERQYADTDREAQALRGGFAAAQGLVYSGFSRDQHVLPHAAARERAGDSWRVYGYDAGWDDPRVCLELGKTSYEQLVVLDAFYESESHLEDVRAWLADNDKPAGTIYCDHEPAQIDKLNRAGYPAEAATKGLDGGVTAPSSRSRPPVTGASQASVTRWPRSSAAGTAQERPTGIRERVAWSAAQRLEAGLRRLQATRAERRARRLSACR